jgi:hypothetical protein
MLQRYTRNFSGKSAVNISLTFSNHILLEKTTKLQNVLEIRPHKEFSVCARKRDIDRRPISLV